MAGLSADPEKRQRQLDALAGGRRLQAERLLGSPGKAVAEPQHDDDELGPVHTYPEERRDAPKQDEPAAELDEPAPPPQPERPSGFLASFRAGLDI